MAMNTNKVIINCKIVDNDVEHIHKKDISEY